MAINVDNSLGRVTTSGSMFTVTSGAFNVAAGDGIIIVGNCDQQNDGETDLLNISDNQTPDLAWVAGPLRGASESGAGLARMWYFHSAAAITGLTVTLTGNSGGNFRPTIKPYLCQGHDSADMLGAVNEGTLNADPQTTSNITSETAGAFFAAWTDWNATGSPTSSDLTVSSFHIAGAISGSSGYKAIASAGATVNGNMNSGGTPIGNWICWEIRAAAGGEAVLPPRAFPQYQAAHRAATI